jgi:outer membrane protein assembly factor BamE (lipoprotein component of BamABCDE complex)
MKKIALFFTGIFIWFLIFLTLDNFYQKIYWPDYISPIFLGVFQYVLVFTISIIIFYFLFKKKDRRLAFWFAAGFGIMLAIALALSIYAYRWKNASPEYIKAKQIKIGMDEKEVYKLLGQPFKIYEKETAPENYYLEGYAIRKRRITNRVLLYGVGPDEVWYIYIDRQNRVEYITRCGS